MLLYFSYMEENKVYSMLMEIYLTLFLLMFNDLRCVVHIFLCDKTVDPRKEQNLLEHMDLQL